MVIYLLSLIPRHTAHWCPMLFSSPFFHVLVFSGLLFSSCVIGFLSCLFFMTKVSTPLSSTLSSGFDWLWFPMTCGPRDGVGKHMEQKSSSKSLSWTGFDLWTSRFK